MNDEATIKLLKVILPRALPFNELLTYIVVDYEGIEWNCEELRDGVAWMFTKPEKEIDL